MRSLEAMLVFANLLTFLVLAVPLPCALRWMRHAVPVVLAVAAAQVLIEGPRWEMAPAYMLTGLFCLLANRLVMGLGLGLGVLGVQSRHLMDWV